MDTFFFTKLYLSVVNFCAVFDVLLQVFTLPHLMCVPFALVFLRPAGALHQANNAHNSTVLVCDEFLFDTYDTAKRIQMVNI